MTNILKYTSATTTEEKDLLSIISNDDTWVIWKTKVISYRWCKKIADSIGYRVSKQNPPNMYCTPDESNKMQHIWWIFLEHSKNPDVYVFAEGEASRYNTWEYKESANSWAAQYKEMGKIDASYRSAMAYKRAYCRAVLMLSWLDKEWFYSDVESSSFKKTWNPDSSLTNSLDYSNI